MTSVVLTVIVKILQLVYYGLLILSVIKKRKDG